MEGDSFRCGDITFLLEGSTIRSPRVSLRQDGAAKTIPSPLALDVRAVHHPTAVSPVAAPPPPSIEDDQRYKDKLFLLIRASEMCVSEMSVDRILEELVLLAGRVLVVDRIALLTLDETSLVMQTRVVKSFVPPNETAWSRRVVDWVVDHGSPASFIDVSRDRTLPGDVEADRIVRGAMCVPINPGGGIIGVIYTDSLSRTNCFRPDDLALLRALANLAAVTIESANLRGAHKR